MALKTKTAEEKALERLTNSSPNEDWVLVSDSTEKLGLEEIKRRLKANGRLRPR